MADRYLLESGAPDGYLLEDGSGVYLLNNSIAWERDTSSLNYSIDDTGLIATHSITGTDNLVRANTGHTTGDYSYVISVSASGVHFVGLANATEAVSGNFCGSTSNSIGWFSNDGNIYQNNITVLTPAVTWVDFDLLTIRIKNGNLYLAKNGTYIGSMNPVAETGGIDVSGMGTLYPAASVNAGQVFTADFTNWVTATGRTGTLSNTLGVLTASSTGTLKIAGTLNKTLGVLTSSSTATLKIAGTLSKTLGTLTLSSQGKVLLKGTLSGTLGTLALSSTGKLKIVGTLNKTLGTLTGTETGQLLIKGSLSKTLGVLTLSSTGRLNVSSSLNKTLGVLTVSSAGKLLLKGSLTGTLGTLTSASTGRLLIKGTVNTTLARLTGTETGQLLIKGSLNATLSPLLLSGTGHLANGITGVLSVALGPLILYSTTQKINRIKIQSIGGLRGSVLDQVRRARQPRTRTSSYRIRQ